MTTTTEHKLTAKRVKDTGAKCMYKDEEITGLKPGEAPEGCVVAKGIMTTFGFHPGRLEEVREDVTEMLMELPPTFGEGQSFLNAAEDKVRRASQDCICECGTRYGDHPFSEEDISYDGYPYLHVLCNGDKVKL